MRNLFNIQYTKKFPFIKVSKKDFFAIFMIASAMGFLAFIYETPHRWINYKIINKKCK